MTSFKIISFCIVYLVIISCSKQDRIVINGELSLFSCYDCDGSDFTASINDIIAVLIENSN